MDFFILRDCCLGENEGRVDRLKIGRVANMILCRVERIELLNEKPTENESGWLEIIFLRCF